MSTRFALRLRRAIRILTGRGDHDQVTAMHVAYNVSVDVARRLDGMLLLFGADAVRTVLKEIQQATIDGLRLYDEWMDTPEDQRPIPF